MMRTSGSAEEPAERTGRGGPEVGERVGCRCAPLCASDEVTAPVLLLGLGNPLMSDDGAGQELLARLESEAPNWGGKVEFLDGGTQGLALLGRFEGRKAVLFLDAVRLGDKPGAVHSLRGDQLVRMGSPGVTAHEGSAPQILAALQLLGEVPQEVAVVGIEPERLSLGIGLSPQVQAGLPAAASVARRTITKILTAI